MARIRNARGLRRTSDSILDTIHRWTKQGRTILREEVFDVASALDYVMEITAISRDFLESASFLGIGDFSDLDSSLDEYVRKLQRRAASSSVFSSASSEDIKGYVGDLRKLANFLDLGFDTEPDLESVLRKLIPEIESRENGIIGYEEESQLPRDYQKRVGEALRGMAALVVLSEMYGSFELPGESGGVDLSGFDRDRLRTLAEEAFNLEFRVLGKRRGIIDPGDMALDPEANILGKILYGLEFAKNFIGYHLLKYNLQTKVDVLVYDGLSGGAARKRIGSTLGIAISALLGLTISDGFITPPGNESWLGAHPVAWSIPAALIIAGYAGIRELDAYRARKFLGGSLEARAGAGRESGEEGSQRFRPAGRGGSNPQPSSPIPTFMRSLRQRIGGHGDEDLDEPEEDSPYLNTPVRELLLMGIAREEEREGIVGYITGNPDVYQEAIEVAAEIYPTLNRPNRIDGLVEIVEAAANGIGGDEAGKTFWELTGIPKPKDNKPQAPPSPVAGEIPLLMELYAGKITPQDFAEALAGNQAQIDQVTASLQSTYASLNPQNQRIVYTALELILEEDEDFGTQSVLFAFGLPYNDLSALPGPLSAFFERGQRNPDSISTIAETAIRYVLENPAAIEPFLEIMHYSEELRQATLLAANQYPIVNVTEQQKPIYERIISEGARDRYTPPVAP